MSVGDERVLHFHNLDDHVRPILLVVVLQPGVDEVLLVLCQLGFTV